MKKVSKWFSDNLSWLVLLFVGLLCAGFITFGNTAKDGYISLTGGEVTITETTKQWIEDANATLNRIMNIDKPTDEETIKANDVQGQGSVTTLEQVLARRLPDGDTDNGLKWQCSKYTAYLATGKREYSTVHTDYGPVNGKDVAAWLVRNYGWKYIDIPVAGAIGSGGFNTAYGHTAMFLYSTGANTAMVNDANAVPYTVSTWNMNISGWVWVVPGDYEPKVDPEPTPEPVIPEPIAVDCKRYTVKQGDTMGKIMLECEGNIDWSSMNAYADSWYSTIIKPGQSVYTGWVTRGVGLYAGDVIERK